MGTRRGGEPLIGSWEAPGGGVGSKGPWGKQDVRQSQGCQPQGALGQRGAESQLSSQTLARPAPPGVHSRSALWCLPCRGQGALSAQSPEPRLAPLQECRSSSTGQHPKAPPLNRSCTHCCLRPRSAITFPLNTLRQLGTVYKCFEVHPRLSLAVSSHLNWTAYERVPKYFASHSTKLFLNLAPTAHPDNPGGSSTAARPHVTPEGAMVWGREARHSYLFTLCMEMSEH